MLQMTGYTGSTSSTGYVRWVTQVKKFLQVTQWAIIEAIDAWNLVELHVPSAGLHRFYMTGYTGYMVHNL